MSYAEQYFGSKQNQILIYADNLAWFGKESYVYKNTSIMLEVIKNPLTLHNPIVGLYAYMWARENGYAANTLFKQGQIISIYNSDINRSFEFVLASFNDDGTANFISTSPAFVFPLSTTSDGTQLLSYKNYDFVQYLNGENNWFDNWNDRPSNINTINLTYLYNDLRKLNGFMFGISDDVKDMLIPMDSEEKFKVLPVGYSDLENNEFMLNNYLKNLKLMTIGSGAYNFNEKTLSGYKTSEPLYKIGGAYWGALIYEIDDVSVLGSHHLKRGGLLAASPYIYESYQNIGSANSIPNVNGMTSIILKIKM